MEGFRLISYILQKRVGGKAEVVVVEKADAFVSALHLVFWAAATLAPAPP